MFFNILKGSRIFKLAAIGFVLIISVLAVMSYLYYNRETAKKSKATGEAVTLTFDPSSATASANQDFSTTIKAKLATATVVQGYEILVKFDSTKASVKSIEYKLGSVVQSLGDSTNLEGVNSKNSIKLMGEIQSADGFTLGANQEVDVAVITFTSHTSDSAAININQNEAKFSQLAADFSLSDLLGTAAAFSLNPASTTTEPGITATPSATIGPTLPPGAVKLNLKIKFQGIQAKPSTEFNKLSVQVILSGRLASAPTAPHAGDFIAGANGVWSGSVTFANVDLNQQYKVLIKGPKHIQKKICHTLPTETSTGSYRCSEGSITLHAGENNLDFSGITQLVGDLPTQDGVVDSYDVSLVRNNLGKTDAATLRLADLNLDGIVDTQDYSLLIAALSNRSDEE